MTEPTTDRPEWGDVQLDTLIDRATARINTPRIGKMAYHETDADLLAIRDLITALTTTRTALAEASGQADREPSDAEVEAERIAWLDARQAAYRADREAWHVHYEIAPEEVGDAFVRGWDAAHASHLAAQEVSSRG